VQQQEQQKKESSGRQFVVIKAKMEEQVFGGKAAAGAVAVSPNLADVMGIDGGLSIFADLTRKVAEVQQAFASQDSDLVVLAPTNPAIVALPRKPWHDTDQSLDILPIQEDRFRNDGAKSDERASENIRNFVEAHIVSGGAFKQKQSGETLLGNRLTWREVDGVKRIFRSSSRKDEGIAVLKEVATASNGDIWVLEGVLS